MLLSKYIRNIHLTMFMTPRQSVLSMLDMSVYCSQISTVGLTGELNEF